MQEKLQALEENGVWRLIKRYERSNLLYTKWVYRTKTNTDGLTERLKARLVVCGNERVYQLTFSAAMDMVTVRIILAPVIICSVTAEH